MGEVPLTVEMGHSIARWCASDDHGTACCARGIVADILATMRCEKPDDSWVTLATRAFGPLERDVLG